MKTYLFVFALLTTLCACAQAPAYKAATAPATPAAMGTGGFAVIELFTSEGCSSCPPADKVLSALQQQYAGQPVLLLGFHVDYWNYLGWKDPFSSSAYSQRQRWYAGVMNLESVYTPQTIINGQWQAVGSEKNSIQQHIKNALQQPAAGSIHLYDSVINNNTLQVKYSIATPAENSQLVFVLVQKLAVTAVGKGENRGETLQHINIVRDYSLIENPAADGTKQFSIPAGLKREDVFIAAYLQQTANGHITAAVVK
jgi:hypothetical protein